MPSRLVLALVFVIAFPLAALADEPAAESESELTKEVSEYLAHTSVPETVVTPTRGARDLFELPRAVTVIHEETIREQNPIHLVNTMTLRDAGIIMDQRTTTTGDPIMRGFAGQNLLTLIDGNSLTTLWGEGADGADDMYGKVDVDTVARIEIVRGPNSVLYGSNALGGVINFITRTSPIDYTSGGFEYGGRTKFTYSSNDTGLRARIEAYGATPDLKFLVGYSRANYHDGHRGGDGETLLHTSGREQNFDIRADYRIAEGHELTASILRVYRYSIHRHYRPTQSNVNKRLGLALTWRAEELVDGVTDFVWRAYYQDKYEERRDTGNPLRKYGESDTETWSTDIQASSDVGADNLLTYGVHIYLDDGESPGDEEFTIMDPKPAAADGPDSLWANYGVFLQDEWTVSEDLELTGAVRYDYFVFNSKSTKEFLAGDPNRDESFFRSTNDSFTGGLGVSYALSPKWRLLASYSRGYRQPNPSFTVVQVGAGVRVPSGLEDPITSDNFELGARCRYDAFRGEVVVYYSKLDGFLDWQPGTYKGKDWYDYDGNGKRNPNGQEDVTTLQPVGDAYVTGVEVKGTLILPELIDEVPDGWSVWGGFAFTRGRVDGSDGTDYIRHGQPPRGLLGIRWDDTDPDRAAYVELVTEMVAKFDDVPEGREGDLAWVDDQLSANPSLLRSYNGVPGYTVFNLYAGMNVCDNAKVTLGIENIANKKYRRAHSRMDAFGLNVILSLEVEF